MTIEQNDWGKIMADMLVTTGVRLQTYLYNPEALESFLKEIGENINEALDGGDKPLAEFLKAAITFIKDHNNEN